MTETLWKVTEVSSPFDQLDQSLRDEIARLLNEASIWSFGSYGWRDENNVDPEFVGHAMWQTDPPVSFDHLLSARSGDPLPVYPQWQRLAAVSGADLGGLMDAARMSIGQFLIQARLLQGKDFGDDSFFDLHWMSSVIYLATASERLRDFFIAAVFRKSQKRYNRGGDYKGQPRAWFSTPFHEAPERMGTFPDLMDVLLKLCPLAEQIRQLRDTRNDLIHKLATEIGHRERRLLDTPSAPVDVREFDYANIRQFAEKAKAERFRRIEDTIKQLSVLPRARRLQIRQFFEFRNRPLNG